MPSECTMIEVSWILHKNQHREALHGYLCHASHLRWNVYKPASTSHTPSHFVFVFTLCHINALGSLLCATHGKKGHWPLYPLHTIKNVTKRINSAFRLAARDEQLSDTTAAEMEFSKTTTTEARHFFHALAAGKCENRWGERMRCTVASGLTAVKNSQIH